MTRQLKYTGALRKPFTVAVLGHKTRYDPLAGLPLPLSPLHAVTLLALDPGNWELLPDEPVVSEPFGITEQSSNYPPTFEAAPLRDDEPDEPKLKKPYGGRKD